MAMELGRLDAISLLLTVLGILLAVLALVGFGYIENRAVVMAKETASAYSIQYFKDQEVRAAQNSAISAAIPIVAGEINTRDVEPESDRGGNV